MVTLRGCAQCCAPARLDQSGVLDVFNAFANLGRSGPLLGAVKGMALAASLAFGMAVAAPAQATTVIIENGTMDNARQLVISGMNNNNPIRATAMQFDGYYSIPGPNNDIQFENVAAFCVDVYHNITTGNYNPDLEYVDTVNITTDSNPNAALRKTLSQDQLDQVGRLVNYGTRVFYQAPKTTSQQKAARYDQLAAVQGAIWKVITGKTVTAVNNGSSTNTKINGLILTFSDLNYRFNTAAAYQLGAVSTKVTYWTPKVYPSKYGSQSFALGSVPEPATWVMMIGGFAFAGAMLRRSRQRPAMEPTRH